MSKMAAELAKRLKGFEGKVAQVGWFESAKYPNNGPQVAEVAIIHEFGAPAASIPARPIFRPVIDKNRAMWAEKLGSGARAVMHGNASAEQVLEQVGSLAAGQLRTHLGSGDFQPLSPTTLMLRKWKDKAKAGGKLLKVTGATVGAAAAAVADGEDYSLAGDRSQPLHDTGYMISTLVNLVGPEPKND